MITSLDTETTGLDVFHGVKPFIVTTCQPNKIQTTWEWDVDPYTRNPIIPERDILDIQEYIDSADEIIFHNAKFDVHVLATIIPGLKWNWTKTHDTMVAAHVLRSNEDKDLTSLCIDYLDYNPQHFEDKVSKAVKWSIGHYKKYFQDKKNKTSKKWRIAKRDLEEMPSAKNKVWKYDMWLPRAIAKRKELPDSDSLWHVARQYADSDSAITITLWNGNDKFPGLRKLLEQRGLYKHYLFRMRSIQIAHDMEHRGVTHSISRTAIIEPKYKKESERIAHECVSIAERLNYDLVMPKKGFNNSLRNFLINGLKLPPVYNKDGVQTFDKKEAMPHYRDTLTVGSQQYQFIKYLMEKSDYDNALSYLRDYKRFSIRTEDSDTLLLHPNLNPTGSRTLRWSHNNPNSANVSKQPDAQGFTLRHCFGPAPGREWWSLDARNVERRIPDFESNEQSLIELYEKENEPPYYGSFHILVFSIIWEELWNAAIKEVGIERAAEYCKTKYKATQYQWTKNFNFAVQYGSGEMNADKTARRIGAYRMVAQRLTKLNTLNLRCIDFANKYGYVETLPDRRIDPTKGYPLLCTKVETGRVLTTIPLSYRVQGTAMWITSSAMDKCEYILDDWRNDGFNAYMNLQIHDEVIFDLPRRDDPRINPRRSNLGRMRIIQKTMSSCGNDLVPSIPVPFSLGYHPETWSKEIAF